VVKRREGPLDPSAREVEKGRSLTRVRESKKWNVERKKRLVAMGWV